MAKYKVLKAERDDAVARALEAERLSNKEVVEDLERRLAQVTRERDEAREGKKQLQQKLVECKGFLLEISERSTQFVEPDLTTTLDDGAIWRIDGSGRQ